MQIRYQIGVFVSARVWFRTSICFFGYFVVFGSFQWGRQLQKFPIPVVPRAHQSLPSNRHLNRFSCFCRAHKCDQQTQDHITQSVAIGAHLMHRVHVIWPKNRSHDHAHYGLTHDIAYLCTKFDNPSFRYSRDMKNNNLKIGVSCAAGYPRSMSPSDKAHTSSY